ncbi:MAG: hypothetical protein HY731_01400 [Candidatus Tectomicrobia bacterium]|nr:hypothetical protein [Candidatus Tectomicrobia bacterium]
MKSFSTLLLFIGIMSASRLLLSSPREALHIDAIMINQIWRVPLSELVWITGLFSGLLLHAFRESAPKARVSMFYTFSAKTVLLGMLLGFGILFFVSSYIGLLLKSLRVMLTFGWPFLSNFFLQLLSGLSMILLTIILLTSLEKVQSLVQLLIGTSFSGVLLPYTINGGMFWTYPLLFVIIRRGWENSAFLFLVIFSILTNFLHISYSWKDDPVLKEWILLIAQHVLPIPVQSLAEVNLFSSMIFLLLLAPIIDYRLSPEGRRLVRGEKRRGLKRLFNPRNFALFSGFVLLVAFYLLLEISVEVQRRTLKFW